MQSFSRIPALHAGQFLVKVALVSGHSKFWPDRRALRAEMYSKETMLKYRTCEGSECWKGDTLAPPHVYDVARHAFESMIASGKVIETLPEERASEICLLVH